MMDGVWKPYSATLVGMQNHFQLVQITIGSSNIYAHAKMDDLEGNVDIHLTLMWQFALEPGSFAEIKKSATTTQKLWPTNRVIVQMMDCLCNMLI